MPSTVRVQLQLRIVSDGDTVIRDEVILRIDKSDEASRRSACAHLRRRQAESLAGRSGPGPSG